MPRAVRIGLVQHLAGIVVDHDVRIGRLIIRAVQETVMTRVDAALGLGPFAVLALSGRTGFGRDIAQCRQGECRCQNNGSRTVDAPAPTEAGGKGPRRSH